MTAPALDDKAHTLHDSIEQLSIDRQVTDESGSENDRDVVGNAGVSSGKKKKKKKRKAKKSKVSQVYLKLAFEYCSNAIEEKRGGLM